MFILFLAALLGILFSIFATLNTSPIILNFGYFTLPNVPVYLAILVPVLLTLVASLGVQIIRNLTSTLKIKSQKNTIKSLKRELAEVTKKCHKLELENAEFKNEVGEPTDTNSI
ncbi:MAG: hypothetical protein QY322_03890 [bacterium]|nr:MAG: hypothetical protein QY322_03890 [bacterium]